MFVKKVVAGVAAVAMMLSLSACGEKITELTLPETIEVEVGNTASLALEYAAGDNADAEALAEAAAKLTLTWTSSDETVATVDAEGKVTALTSGECDVTVATEDGKLTATCRVVVPEPAAPVEDDANAAKVALDSEGADGLEMMTENGIEIPETVSREEIAWTSSDENVATVDENGHITPVGVGECVITATLADANTWSAELHIVVCEHLDEATTDTDTDTETKDTEKDTEEETDVKKPAATSTPTTGSGNKDGSTATGGETVSGGNNTPAPTPVPAPDPTPAPDTGNNDGNLVTGGGNINDIIPGAPEKNPDGTWEGDGGNAEYNPAPIPPEPDPAPPADNGNLVTGGGNINDIIQGAPEQNPDGTWEGDGGNAEYNPAPIPPEPTF